MTATGPPARPCFRQMTSMPPRRRIAAATRPGGAAPLHPGLFVVAAGACLTTTLAASAALAAEPVVISVVATTDLHGHVESLPWLAGHLANLRAARAAGGGAVVLVDAGDMFQGTLESNLGEGAAVVRGYNALGYTAVAIGNHEFDFGPAGPAHVPTRAGDDPQGALKARAAEARYPFLAANVRASGSQQPIAWKNVRPHAVVTVAGVKLAIIGGTTMSTPRATHPRNFAGLEVRPLLDAVTESARAARAAGATVVIVVTHAGGECRRFELPDDLSSCDPGEEIFVLARALPAGLVDAIAAGHTHQGVAHRVAGIAIVQAHAEGRAFARIDLAVDRTTGKLVSSKIFAPTWLCGGPRRVPSFARDACKPAPYEGAPVRFDDHLARVIAPDVARAARRRAQPLGVTLSAPVWRANGTESPLGNLAADLMRAETPEADVAFINGGSLRADLPAGPLSYGKLYEAFPFDDGLSTLRLTAADLGKLIARNLARRGGILSLSGVRASAVCQRRAQGGPALEVHLARPDGSTLDPRTPLLAVTNGYLASGGDGLLEGIVPVPGIEGDNDLRPARDGYVTALRARGSRLRADDPALYDPARPRLSYPGTRPVSCPDPP
jgi:2',3'-cyclic-nucleotide 2'-phosphodiesterase (5'-nucleotidase family)